MKKEDNQEPGKEKEDDALAPLVVDFGKSRRKQIKRLRRGEGKLMDRVHETIEELQARQAIPSNAQPIIIVVKEKRKKRKKMFGM